MIKVKVENLKKSFGSLEVLKDINMEVKEGEVVCLIGPSGSGKSTFLRCLNKLEEPTGGVIIVDDYDLMAKTSDINKIRENIGMVFQHFNLFPHMTILKNMIIAPMKLQGKSEAEATELAMKLLRRVGLEDRANAYPSQLSGGQKQRIAIVRALCMQPEVMLFDEPTSALDPELTGEVLKTIQQLADENMTMAIVTHEMAFAKSVSDKVLFMVDGKVEEEGTSTQIFENPQSERTRSFLQSILR